MIGWGIAFKGYLILYSIRPLRRVAIGDYMYFFDPSYGWRAAKAAGCKCVKVNVEVVESETTFPA
jgi:hypothetical protein